MRSPEASAAQLCRSLGAALLALLTGVAAAEGAARPSDAPFLWQVRNERTTHYLLGSMHLLPEAERVLPPGIRRAFDASRSLVFESDLEAISAPAGVARMVDAAVAPNGLAAEVDAPLLARVRARVTELGMPAELCERRLPWFCALSLDLVESQRAGLVVELGLDRQLHEQAIRTNRSIAWFEAPAEHVALLTEMPKPLSRQMLRATLDDAKRPNGDPIRLYRAWRDHDVATLESLVAELKRDHRGLHDRLLAQRNRRWLPDLRRYLARSDTQLIVVGAAHWVGPDGLLAYLRADGYDIRPVATATGVAAELTAP